MVIEVIEALARLVLYWVALNLIVLFSGLLVLQWATIARLEYELWVERNSDEFDARKPRLIVPPNKDDAISYETIENGMQMVDFHNERKFERYYTKASYDSLNPKQNPITRKPIRESDVMYYIADVSA
jgi:hypothetical protein